MKRFGKYLLYERLAKGGMAEIYRARSADHSGPVVVKRILPEFSEEPEFLRMFVDEGNVLASLRHRNIVEILDLGVVDGCYYIAMEHIQGLPLNRLVHHFTRQEQAFPLAYVPYLASEVASGLDFAHTYCDADGNHLGIVHRDVSPPNILVSVLGEVKVIDFGIAQIASRSLMTTRGALRGKIAYMSPEQARGEAIDQRSDIYALGCVLHYMLTGKSLYKGSSSNKILPEVQQGRGTPATQASHCIPHEIELVLQRALAFRPEDRYQSAHEMAAELRDLLGSLEGPSRSDVPGRLALAMRQILRGDPGAGTSAGMVTGSQRYRWSSSISGVEVDRSVPPDSARKGSSRSTKPQVSVELRTEEDIIKARKVAMDLARKLGMKKAASVRLGTVVSELVRTIRSFSSYGVLQIDRMGGNRTGLKLTLSDAPPDDESLDTAEIVGRKKSRYGMGAGIATARKLMDHFSIQHGFEGTMVITAVKYIE